MLLKDKPYDILHGDSASVLKTLPDECVDMCVTSPPYFGLRVYGSGEQEIGQEETPLEYIQRLRDVFHEVHRVLKPTGTLWLNLGDTYNGNKKGNTEIYKNPELSKISNGLNKKEWKGLPPKSLIGIPWRVAFALQDDEWVLRSDIIFWKPNAMPQSVTDRCSSSHEYIFMFSKHPSGYYFDYEAIEEPANFDAYKKPNDSSVEQSLFPDLNESSTKTDGIHIKFGGTKYPDSDSGADITYSGKEWKPKYKNLMADEKGRSNHSFHERRAEGLKDEVYMVRRKRDVWAVPTHGYSGAHFATFPEKLVEPCILAGCPKNGIVLDCFNGAGTTGVVALKNHRRYLGIELNEEYIKLSRERIDKETAQQTFAF